MFFLANSFSFLFLREWNGQSVIPIGGILSSSSSNQKRISKNVIVVSSDTDIIIRHPKLSKSKTLSNNKQRSHCHFSYFTVLSVPNYEYTGFLGQLSSAIGLGFSQQPIGKKKSCILIVWNREDCRVRQVVSSICNPCLK